MSDRMLPAVQVAADGETASGLEIRLFGPMEVRIGPHPLPRLRSRKGLWLLGLLTLCTGRRIERAWLAGTLWPDYDPAAAKRSLRQSLHDLRLALGPEAGRLIADEPRTLRLDLDGAFVDVLAFDSAIAAGNLDSLEAAVRLYRGPLLAECAEEWSLAERQQREQTYVAALERLASAAAACRELVAAVSYLRLAVGVDPYREDLQRTLMEALAAGGNPAAALIVYRQLRALLWREMAAEPAVETTALFQRLREETRARARPSVPATRLAVPPSGVPPDPGPMGNLPQPLSALIGREREILEVDGCLASARLVTLTGPGGIGKTRLAIRVAEEVAWEYADGAWFVDLAGLTEAALVPQAVARALQVPETAGSSFAESLLKALGSRQLLLLLDNCEHLIDACARLADVLLSGCPHLRILATSRQSLGLTGEISWPVPALSLPPAGEGVGSTHFVGTRASGVGGSEAERSARGPTPDILLQYEAIRLFVQRAAAASGFALGESNASATVQVCRRLDGIPLAIELAASRLKVLSVEQIAVRLDDRFRLLTGGSRTALPRQQTLRATLDWSYELLSEPERILLRRLSVFTGGFTLEAAEAVCSDFGSSVLDFGLGPAKTTDALEASTLPAIQNPKSKIQNTEVLDLLTQLVDRSLVGVEQREEVAHYFLLETTREYARERLREAGEEEERQARHAQCFLALAERAEPELRGAAQAQWLQRLEEEHDNCRAALDYCLAAGAVEAGLRLGGALSWFWWMRGYFSEGRERLQALLIQSGYEIEAAEPGRPIRVARPAEDAGHSERVRQAQAKALNAAGGLADDQSDYEAARALCEESLALCRELGDRPGAAAALNGLGGLARHAHDCAAARALYEESLALWRAVGDRWWTAAILTNLGRVAFLEGEYATARAHIESAIEIQRQLQDQRVIARSLSQLGSIAARQGDYEAAHALHSESLSIVRKLGAKQAIEGTLCDLGRVATEVGDHHAALAYHEERLAIARELGIGWGVAESLYYLGLLARDRGQESRAQAFWSECLALSQRLGDQSRVAECLEGLAKLGSQRGKEEPG